GKGWLRIDRPPRPPETDLGTTHRIFNGRVVPWLQPSGIRALVPACQSLGYTQTHAPCDRPPACARECRLCPRARAFAFARRESTRSLHLDGRQRRSRCRRDEHAHSSRVSRCCRCHLTGRGSPVLHTRNGRTDGPAAHVPRESGRGTAARGESALS